MRLPRAQQHQHFGYERRHTGQSHPREERKPGYRGIDRHLLREPAEAVYLAMMRAIVDHADQDKEHRRDRPMVEHLENRAIDSGRGE